MKRSVRSYNYMIETELYITEYSQTYNDFGLSQSKLWDLFHMKTSVMFELQTC